jgi:hypothetical protein
MAYQDPLFHSKRSKRSFDGVYSPVVHIRPFTPSLPLPPLLGGVPGGGRGVCGGVRSANQLKVTLLKLFVYVRSKFPSIQTTPQSRHLFPLTHCLPIDHMDVLGVVYLMKRSEWGLAAWCRGSWWCVLWSRNKLPLSNMPSSSRYNVSTGFGRYSLLGGAGEGVQEVHLNCRLW